MRYQPEKVYIGLGSNQGDSLHTIHQALTRINRLPGTRVRSCSHIYRSKALTQKQCQGELIQSPISVQPDFYNAVCEITTYLPAFKLLESLQNIETYLGRRRHQNLWGMPRTIDLDILLFGQQQISTKTLSIPHPEIENRSFVVIPLAEIAPEMSLLNGHSTQALKNVYKRENLRPIANISVQPDGLCKLQAPRIDRTRNQGNLVISFV